MTTSVVSHHMTDWVRARRRARIRVVSVTIAVTLAGYWLFLGWHDLQDYEEWKVAMFAAALAVVAVWDGWQGPAVFGAVIITALLTVVWSIDAATMPVEGANLWPIGAMFVALCAAAGSFLLAAAALAVRLRRIRHGRLE